MYHFFLFTINFMTLEDNRKILNELLKHTVKIFKKHSL